MGELAAHLTGMFGALHPAMRWRSTHMQLFGLRGDGDDTRSGLWGVQYCVQILGIVDVGVAGMVCMCEMNIRMENDISTRPHLGSGMTF